MHTKSTDSQLRKDALREARIVQGHRLAEVSQQL